MNRNKPGSLLIKITSLTLMMMLLLTAVPAQAQTQQELYQQGLDAKRGGEKPGAGADHLGAAGAGRLRASAKRPGVFVSGRHRGGAGPGGGHRAV